MVYCTFHVCGLFECGGGTYIRSLVRDIGIEAGTVATMTSLERTKQGAFRPEHCLHEKDWAVENVWKSIVSCRSVLEANIPESATEES